MMMRSWISAALVCVWFGVSSVSSQPITTQGLGADIERGTYSNYGDCQRSSYAIFAYFGDDSGTDSRLSQFLVGWDTAQAVPTNRPVSHYLISSLGVKVVVANGNNTPYDPTHDALETYFSTNHSAWVPDADPGRPVELFGIGFRNGYSLIDFEQCSDFGSTGPGTANAFAVSWTSNGLPVDVGSNVGKTNEQFTPFETWPFAVGQTTNTTPGGILPTAAILSFELNLRDPFVIGYLQRSLQSGRLDLMVSSLHQVSGQFGAEPYPSLATRFNAALFDPPTTLEMDVTVVRDIDTDSDGLMDDWEQFYFGSLTNAADGDWDGDLLVNLSEQEAGTDPTDALSTIALTIQVGVSATMTLSSPVAASREYELQLAEGFGGWTTLTNAPTFSQQGTASWQDDAGTGTNRFYRLKAMPILD